MNTTTFGMDTIRNKLFLHISILAVIGFGAAFAYNALNHINYMRYGQITLENSAVMREVFEEKLVIAYNVLAPVESTYVVNVDNNCIPNPIIYARELTENADIVAYIFVEGTNIEGVILQGENNQFYLERDVYKRFNVNGSIFLDYQNRNDFTDRNTIIYAHNMRNGIMFHDLQFFMQPEYFANHRYITILTENHVLTYEIFAAFSTHIAFEYVRTRFVDDYDFEYFVHSLKERAVNRTETVVETHDRIILLSTCTGTHRDMRYVVAGKLVKADEL